MKYGLGWHRDAPDHRDLIFSLPVHPASALPPSVSLVDKAPPIYDQGNLGSCTAHAAAFCYQFTELEESHQLGVPARLQIYYSARRLQGTVRQDSGSSIRTVFKGIAKDGYSRDAKYPYRTQYFKANPPAAVWKDAAAHKPGAQGKAYIRSAQDLTALKTLLSQSNPVAFGFSVPESFMSQGMAHDGRMLMPRSNESIVGGHAVALVGYDDVAKRFLVRNSWGTGWGQAGYFTMPYEFLADPNWCSDFWSVLDAPG